MEAASTEELVRQCQQAKPGDTRAFERLVQYFSSRVYAIAYRMLGDAHDADDMAQEVFIKAYHGIKDLGEPTTFVAWLYRITTNTCLDYLDKKGRRPKTAPLLPDTDEQSSEVFADRRTRTPEEAVLQAEIRSCIEQTLAEMGSVERAILVLRDVEDRPYQEIAESLALSLSAVKMRIHRARVAFGQLLQRICPDTWRSAAAVPAAVAVVAQPVKARRQ